MFKIGDLVKLKYDYGSIRNGDTGIVTLEVGLYGSTNFKCVKFFNGAFYGCPDSFLDLVTEDQNENI